MVFFDIAIYIIYQYLPFRKKINANVEGIERYRVHPKSYSAPGHLDVILGRTWAETVHQYIIT